MGKLAQGETTMETKMDFIVHVDRSVKPGYPEWIKGPKHSKLECSGPVEYNLQTGVEQWLHDDQKMGVVSGNIIYRHLQKNDGLASCLNLQDGLAIQAKGIAVFRKLFADGKTIFFWGSVVQSRGGNLLYVPYLYGGYGDKVGLHWHWLDHWLSSQPALRFGK